MKKFALVVIMLTLGGNAFAQPKPAATTTTPAATAPAAPTFTVRSINPVSVASATTDIKKEVVIRGTGLKGTTDVKFVSSVGQIDPVVVDNSSDTMLKLSIDVKADDNDTYALHLGGASVEKMTLTVKDSTTLEHEKIVRQAAAGAAAAAKVKTMEATIKAMQSKITALEGRPQVSQQQVQAMVTTTVTQATSEVRKDLMLVQQLSLKTDAKVEALTAEQKQLSEAVMTLAATPVKTGGKKPLNASIADKMRTALAAANAAMIVASNDKK